MSNFANFMKINGLKRKDVASFLGVSGAFITQISTGERPLPDDKLAMIKANAYGWDVSMLDAQYRSSAELNALAGNMREHKNELTQEQLRSVIEKVMSIEEESLVGYLERKVQDQDKLIHELYQQIGMLQAKLDLARKGETVSDVTGSLSADAV